MNKLITLKIEQQIPSEVSLYRELVAHSLELGFYPAVTPYIWGVENRAVYHHKSGVTLVISERLDNLSRHSTGYKSTFDFIGANTPVRAAQSAIEELAKTNDIEIVLNLPKEEKQ